MLHGDLGQSLTMDRPAAPLIVDALGRSAILAGLAFALVAVGGIGFGVYARDPSGPRCPTASLTLAQFVFIAVPEFFWAILAILFFASWLSWLPATGYAPLAEAGFGAGRASRPAGAGAGARPGRPCLAPDPLLDAGGAAQPLRAGGARQGPAASARAVAPRAAATRCCRPSPCWRSMSGLLIGGVVVVETVFAYPGLGRLLVFAIEHHDLPLLQAGMMVVTAIYALANLVADLLLRGAQSAHPLRSAAGVSGVRARRASRRRAARAAGRRRHRWRDRRARRDRHWSRRTIPTAFAVRLRLAAARARRIRSAPTSSAATCCPACWPARIFAGDRLRRHGDQPRCSACRSACSPRSTAALVEEAIMRARGPADLAAADPARPADPGGDAARACGRRSSPSGSSMSRSWCG